MALGTLKCDTLENDSSQSITVASLVNLDSNKANLSGATFTGDITLNAQQEVRWADSDSSNYIAFASPATVSTNSTWTLPSDAPVAGDALKVTSVSSNNPTLEWGTITTKIVGCTVFQDNTRFTPSNSSSVDFIQWFTFNYNKQQSGTDLWVWGTTQGYGAFSGGGSLEVQYGSTIDRAAGAIHYPNTYGIVLAWSGRITGHTTTGSQAFKLGHRNNDQSRPASVIHPQSTDHSGFPTAANGGSGTTIYVFEVDV